MRTLIHSFLIIGISIIFFQCQSDEPLPNGTIIVALEGETLEIHNRYGQSISYFAVESETAALINWAAVSDEENTIVDSGVKTVPWGNITGAPVQPGDEIIINWWPAQAGTIDPATVNQRVIVL